MKKLRVFEAFSNEEIWIDIDGYEEVYQVSNFGRIKSLSRMIFNGKGYYLSKEKILKGSKNEKGYLQVELLGKPMLIHRIVATMFIDNPYNKPQVNHIDGDKTNNHVLNLEWCDNSENQIHAYKLGLSKRSEDAGKKKKKVCQIDLETGKIINIFDSIADAKRYFNVSKINISEVCKGNRKSCLGYGWKYFEEGDAINE